MNRFFKDSDKTINKVNDFEIPNTWWSRPYEYKFAIDFLREGERVLDVGCGIEHPFKYHASNIVKEVVAIDKIPTILDIDTKKYKNLKLECCDILNYKDEKKFDKIFCISVLEHTQSFMVEKLENIKKLLKDKGKIIITCDSPILKPDKLLEFTKRAGLKLVGKNDYDSTKDIIKSARYELYCYSMILKK